MRRPYIAGVSTAVASVATWGAAQTQDLPLAVNATAGLGLTVVSVTAVAMTTHRLPSGRRRQSTPPLDHRSVTGGDRSRLPPSKLLRPHAEVAAFTGHDDELAALDAWLAGDEPLVVVYGQAGAGKTRLIRHWALHHRKRKRLASLHTYVGLLPPTAGREAIEAAADCATPTLLLVPDAELHPDLPAVLQAVADHRRGRPHVRLLLETRSPDDLARRLPNDSALLAAPQRLMVAPPPRSPAWLQDTARAYARAHQGALAPERPAPMPSSAPESMLDTQVRAALAAFDNDSGAPHDVAQHLLDIELGWISAHSTLDPALDRTTLRRCLIAITLAAANTVQDAVTAIGRLPDFDGTAPERKRAIARMLVADYGSVRVDSVLLTPERITALLLAQSLSDDPELADSLMPHADASAAAALIRGLPQDGPDTAVLALGLAGTAIGPRLVVALAALAAHPDGRDLDRRLHDRLIEHADPQETSAAIGQTLDALSQTAERFPATLAAIHHRRIQALLREGADRETLHDPLRTLWRLQRNAELPGEVDSHRMATELQRQPPQDPLHIAKHLNGLADAAARWKDHLTVTATRAELAVLYVQLDAAPATRADNLRSLGWHHTALGEHEQALRADRDAVGVYRAADSPSRLAGALYDLGYDHRKLGQEEAADAAFGESIEIYRELRKTAPDEHAVEFSRPLLEAATTAKEPIRLIDEAIRALEVHGSAGGRVPNSLVVALCKRSTQHADAGQDDRARSDLARATELSAQLDPLASGFAHAMEWVGYCQRHVSLLQLPTPAAGGPKPTDIPALAGAEGAS